MVVGLVLGKSGSFRVGRLQWWGYHGGTMGVLMGAPLLFVDFKKSGIELSHSSSPG